MLQGSNCSFFQDGLRKLKAQTRKKSTGKKKSKKLFEKQTKKKICGSVYSH